MVSSINGIGGLPSFLLITSLPRISRRPAPRGSAKCLSERALWRALWPIVVNELGRRSCGVQGGVAEGAGTGDKSLRARQCLSEQSLVTLRLYPGTCGSLSWLFYFNYGLEKRKVRVLGGLGIGLSSFRSSEHLRRPRSFY